MNQPIQGHGQVARLLRQLDWTSHALGAPERWPAGLRAAVTACLASRSPMQVWWGPSRWVFYNDAFLPWVADRHPRALGQPVAEVLGARWELFEAGVERAFSEGVVAEAGGLTMAPLFGDSGTVQGLVCTFTNDRADDDLVSRIGQEARSPISTLAMISEAFALRVPNEAASLTSCVHQLMRAIDDVLDLARLARGQLTLDRTSCELAPIIDRAVQLAGDVPSECGVRLVVNAERTGLLVKADAERLARAIADVLVGMAHASVRDGTLAISASNVQLGVRVVLSAPLREAAPAEPLLGGGMCRNIIEMHGGLIRSATLDGEQHVIIGVPSADATTDTLAPPSSAGKRVLVVDDDDTYARTLALILEQLGYIVELAHDGAIALQVAAELAPDIVLIDIGLPVLDGWEVARRLRSNLPDVPVIAVTGRSQDADRQRSAEAGFLDHLNKPFSLEQLRRCLLDVDGGQLRVAPAGASSPPR